MPRLPRVQVCGLGHDLGLSPCSLKERQLSTNAPALPRANQCSRLFFGLAKRLGQSHDQHREAGAWCLSVGAFGRSLCCVHAIG